MRSILPDLTRNVLEKIIPADPAPFYRAVKQVAGWGEPVREVDSLQSFDLPLEESALANLAPTLTINGQSVTPTFRYRPGDTGALNLAAWTYGEMLDRFGSSGSKTEMPLTEGRDAFNGVGVDYFTADNNTFVDITTEDFIIEIVYSQINASKILFAKRNGASGNGWLFYTGSSLIRTTLIGAGGSVTVNSASGLTEGAWYHAMCFIDKSGSAQWYVNGVASGPAVSVATVGDLTIDSSFALAAYNNGVLPYTGDIAYVAMWQQADWLDTHLQADVAKERFQRLTGFWPQRATGTKLWTSYTRATTAHLTRVLDDDTQQLFRVGAGWPRLSQARWLHPDIANNSFTETKDFSDAFWTKEACSASQVAAGPPGTQALVYGLIGTVANGKHAFTAQRHPTTTSVHLFRAIVKAAAQTWVRLVSYTGTFASPSEIGGCFFDLANGVTGTETGLLSKEITDLGEGWYDCCIRYTGPAADHGHAILAAPADNDQTYSGDGSTVDLIVAASTHEYNLDNPTNMLLGTQGYLVEQAATNLLPYSQEFDNAAWTKTRLTVSADSTTAPDGSSTADTLVEDGTAANTHFIGETFTQAATTYTYAVRVKAANRSWVRLELTSSTDGAATVDFDATNGVIGTQSGNDSAGMLDLGDGWFHCWLSDTRATAETCTARIYVGEADGDITFNGLSQDSLYVWGAQVEASSYPTSYVKTSGASATRNADVLYYKGDDGNIKNNQTGSLEAKILLSDTDVVTDGYLATLSDNGAAADIIGLYVDTTDVAEVETAATAGNAGLVTGTTALGDGEEHTVRTRYTTDNLDQLLVDETAEGTADTSADMPDDLDRIHVGTDEGGAGQLGGLVSNVKIFKKPTTKG